MNTMRLRVFESLCRLGSVELVANELGIRQPAVTFHLQRLEAELGCGVVSREAKRLRISEVGSEIRTYAERILGLENELLRVAAQLNEGTRGRLSLSASHIPGSYILPSIVARFRERCPDATVSVQIRPVPAARGMLISRQVDAAIIAETVDDRNHPLDGIQRRVLGDDALVLVLPSEHPLSGRETLEPADLEEHAFIHHEKASTTRQTLDAWTQRENVSLNACLELGSVEAIRQAVAAGIGISVISSLTVRHHTATDLVVRPLPGSPARRFISVLWRTDRPSAPLFDSFLAGFEVDPIAKTTQRGSLATPPPAQTAS
jgi:LysR family transcriptional regulator, low CO2-responsive transcriptional regulator